MEKYIAVGGTSANMPHLGHKYLLEALLGSKKFKKVIWIISGERKDKSNLIASYHRLNMTYLTFPKSWLAKQKGKLIILTCDTNRENTPSICWLNRLQKLFPHDHLFWVTGADSIMPRDYFNGLCDIASYWFQGQKLMEEYAFLIMPRAGYPHPKKIALPKQFEIFETKLPNISSSEIRTAIAQGKSTLDLITPEVANYIKRNGLYVPE